MKSNDKSISPKAFDKNFYRVQISDVMENCDNKSAVIYARYKNNNGNKDFCTFITVRPVIPGFYTRTICNHINISRKDVEKYIHLSEENEHQKFMLIVEPCSYMKDGCMRAGFRLATSNGIQPIFATKDYQMYINKTNFKDFYVWPDEYKKRDSVNFSELL